jgi:hypothetical protein
MTTKNVPDYYAILGVPQNASLTEIRLAYRRQARMAHPDMNADPEAEERFRRINEAYEVLANPEKRRAYDFFVSNAENGGETQPPAGSGSTTAEQGAPPPEAGASPPVEPSIPEQTGAQSSPPGSEPTKTRTRLTPPTWVLLLIMMGAIIILAIVASGLLSLRQSQSSGGAASVDVDKRTTFISPPTVPRNLPIIEEGNSPVLTRFPSRLEVDDLTFPVIAVTPEQGRWPLPDTDSTVALWLHGTVVNYVFGIPYSATVESRLAGLSSSDRITVTMETGTELVFGAPKVERVDADNLSPTSQDQPGLTLMTIGGGTTYVLVQARHLPRDASLLDDQRAGDLFVEVLESGIIEGEDPPWTFIVEYRITNRGESVIDPVRFDRVLADDTGQRFSLNAEATALGLYGRPNAPLQPGTDVRGSAGYVLPSDVALPLTWIFRVDAASEDPARHVLAFEKPAPEPARPFVQLIDAFYDAGRDVIVLSGAIENRGETRFEVTAEDISLTSGAGESSLLAASPLLSWSIEPGQEQSFELQFDRPSDTDTALLTLMGFSFEIEGLD